VEYLSTKVTAWSNAGIGSIWLPPVSKAQTALSMGYDPLIILILKHNQMELETRFGSKTELVNLITKAH
jgi:alpha-amylase